MKVSDLIEWLEQYEDNDPDVYLENHGILTEEQLTYNEETNDFYEAVTILID